MNAEEHVQGHIDSGSSLYYHKVHRNDNFLSCYQEFLFKGACSEIFGKMLFIKLTEDKVTFPTNRPISSEVKKAQQLQKIMFMLLFVF